MEDDIVDIVMNIHQFSQDLMKQNIKYYNEIERLQARIDKALEFIEKHNIIGTNKEYLPSEIEKCYSLELMEILQGSDKDE